MNVHESTLAALARAFGITVAELHTAWRKSETPGEYPPDTALDDMVEKIKGKQWGGNDHPSPREAAEHFREIPQAGFKLLHNAKSVAKTLDVPVPLLLKWVKAGVFPSPDLVQGRVRLWLPETVVAWVEEISRGEGKTKPRK